ncbi:MAG TPA: sigma-E factor negative regulatory protein [Rhodocyclaceae bacterium]|nr:sigma-E factor negative regulatory protein [Rhodocyclaceae bacterium]
MNEQLSALMDGELDAEEATLVFARLKASEQSRQSWSDYHLVGDALRSPDYLESDLTARVMEALLEEPVVLAPPQSHSRPRLQRALAMAASVAGVAVVSAVVWTGRTGAVADVAKAPLDRAAMQMASANMQEYLIAHQSQSPNSSMQGAARYIKTVSVETSAGAR